jgi:gluconolactonase
MFAAPPIVNTEIFSRLPDALRKSNETAWSRLRGTGPLHSFLEGPAFDRAGNFFCVDICHGRIFKVSPQGEWKIFAEYDGNPNGLKIHRDGRIFVTDQTQGLLIFDSTTGKRLAQLKGAGDKAFMAPNDLVFAESGELYFTDPGQSGLENPVGRVYRWREGGTPELVVEGLPYPNGIEIDATGRALYIAVTRSLQVIRAPLNPARARAEKCGLFLQLSGGLAGPDGLALDEAGSLAIAHSGLATVWLFDRLGEPLARIKSCAGIRPTNIAYGGADRKTLFITESEEGVILRVQMRVPGRPMYSHR